MVILITGAASGLGWAMAQHWHGQGHQLVLADIDAAGLESAAFILNERVITQVTEISCSQSIDRLVQRIHETVGHVDVLVNNAGITHRSRACDTDPAVLRRVMAVDWQGPVELTHALLPTLRKRRGSIICIGSMAGWMPVPGRAGYCAAKAALAQYFEVLRLELEGDGVHLLMVYPSFVDTAIEQNALDAQGQKASHPRSVVGNVATPGAVVEAIGHALSKRQPWVFPDGVAKLGSILWRLTPRLYQRLIRRQFAGDL